MDPAETPLLPDMPCPRCGRMAAPAEGSTSVVAWYLCPACSAYWSARLRGGRPVDSIELDPKAQLSPAA